MCGIRGDLLIFDKITYEQLNSTYNMTNYDDKKVNIDVKEFKKLLNDYHDMVQRTPYNDDGVYFLLSCIRESIKGCAFNKMQLEKLSMWFDGYTEKEIADKYEVSTVAIHYFLVRACKRIAGQLERKFKKC